MRPAVLALSLTACSPEGADWFPHCDETRTELAADAPTGLGFTAAEALAWIEGTRTDAAVWAADGRADDLETTVTATGPAELVERTEAPIPDDVTEVPDIAVICEDSVQIPATVAFATGDLAFDETLTVALDLPAAEQATASARLDPDELGGTWEPGGTIDTDAYDTWGYAFRLAWEGAAFSGEVALVGEGTSGDTAFAESTPILTWSTDE